MNKKPNPQKSDQDNPEWTPAMFTQALRFEALPEALKAKLRGRPKAASTKEHITMRPNKF